LAIDIVSDEFQLGYIFILLVQNQLFSSFQSKIWFHHSLLRHRFM